MGSPSAVQIAAVVIQGCIFIMAALVFAFARKTARRAAWGFMAGGFALMTVRRITATVQPAEWSGSWSDIDRVYLPAAISLLHLIGVALAVYAHGGK